MAPRYRIEPARGLVDLCLRLLGFDGLFTPWFRIYLRRHRFDDAGLRAHEIAHAEQCARDGYAAFWARTFVYLWRYGYWRSPYEVEARAAQRRVRRNGNHSCTI